MAAEPFVYLNKQHIQLVLGPYPLAGTNETTHVRVSVEVANSNIENAQWPDLIKHFGTHLIQSVESTSAETWQRLLVPRQPLPAQVPVPVPMPVAEEVVHSSICAQCNHTLSSGQTLEQHQRGWKTVACRFGNRCRGEQQCHGYHGSHDQQVPCTRAPYVDVSLLAVGHHAAAPPRAREKPRHRGGKRYQ